MGIIPTGTILHTGGGTGKRLEKYHCYAVTKRDLKGI